MRRLTRIRNTSVSSPHTQVSSVSATRISRKHPSQPQRAPARGRSNARNRHSNPTCPSSIRTTTCGTTSAAVISSMNSSMTFRPGTTSWRRSTPNSRRCIARRARRRCGRWGRWNSSTASPLRAPAADTARSGYAKALLGTPTFFSATMCRRCSKRISPPVTAGSGGFVTGLRGTAAAQDMAGHSRRRTSCSMRSFDAALRASGRSDCRLTPGCSTRSCLDLIDLLQAFPETQVILDHAGGVLGIPPHTRRDEVFSIWRSHIQQLARFPNLSVKIGGLGMLYCGWDFHVRDIPPSSADLSSAWRPYVETCIEAFGPQRCMFESNFPVDKQSSGYGALWNAFKRITQGCSRAEKAALYHDTAARVYRLAR